jgi:hypothetical protein
MATGSGPSDAALPENTRENLERKLDHAIEETFPTSDPVSVTITKGGAIDYDEHGPAVPDQGRSPGIQSARHRRSDPQSSQRSSQRCREHGVGGSR